MFLGACVLFYLIFVLLFSCALVRGIFLLDCFGVLLFPVFLAGLVLVGLVWFPRCVGFGLTLFSFVQFVMGLFLRAEVMFEFF